MNMRWTARLKFDARQVAKNAIYTAFICNFRFRFTHTFLSQKIFMHFLVTKRICAHFFFREHGLRFFAKTINALRPESFCALKVPIRKVQTFWASGAGQGTFKLGAFSGWGRQSWRLPRPGQSVHPWYIIMTFNDLTSSIKIPYGQHIEPLQLTTHSIW